MPLGSHLRILKFFGKGLDIQLSMCYNINVVTHRCWCSSVGRAADL